MKGNTGAAASGDAMPGGVAEEDRRGREQRGVKRKTMAMAGDGKAADQGG